GFFFFSSRRRHTRFSRDWSSDVCSSDLNLIPNAFNDISKASERIICGDNLCGVYGIYGEPKPVCFGLHPIQPFATFFQRVQKWRSEERRVGKDGRLGGAFDAGSSEDLEW